MSLNSSSINAVQLNGLPLFVPTHSNAQSQLNSLIGSRYGGENDLENAVEFPCITVTIKFGDKTFSQTLERGDDYFVPLISVHSIVVHPLINTPKIKR